MKPAPMTVDHCLAVPCLEGDHNSEDVAEKSLRLPLMPPMQLAVNKALRCHDLSLFSPRRSLRGVSLSSMCAADGSARLDVVRYVGEVSATLI